MILFLPWWGTPGLPSVNRPLVTVIAEVPLVYTHASCFNTHYNTITEKRSTTRFTYTIVIRDINVYECIFYFEFECVSIAHCAYATPNNRIN